MKESGDNMASNFWNGEFYFDNIHSSTYKVCIVDFNENNILKQIGSTFSISMEKEMAYRGNPLHRETERIADNIVLQLCKTEGTVWTDIEIADVVGWLFQDTFKKFQPTDFTEQSYNLVYYLKAIEMKKFLNPNLEGYIEITFQPYDAYVYAVSNNSLVVGGRETRTITNLSNVNSVYYPKIRVRNLGNVYNTITISNQTNGKTLSISGMESGEMVIIDCAIGSVVNENGGNRFSVLQNFDFIGLDRGNNVISLSANCTIEFICEFPMII